MMRTSINGEAFIIKEEGERLTSYRCSANVWTIGVGHTGFVDDQPITRGMTISKTKSRELLRADLRRFENAINECVLVSLSQHQFDALVSLTFNIGEGAFRRSTLVKLLNNGDYKGAANQFLAWKNAGGRPILLKRRQREKALFENGYV
ncbi:lysozyme [Pasteurellaceae bacterium 22721_9_1]